MNFIDAFLAEAETETRAALRRHAREAGKIIRRDLRRGRRNFRRSLEHGDLDALVIGGLLAMARRALAGPSTKYQSTSSDPPRSRTKVLAPQPGRRRPEPPRPTPPALQSPISNVKSARKRKPRPPERPADRIIEVKATRL